MDEKIKKLATKIEGLLPNVETPQQTYDYLNDIARKQKDYFIHIGPENFVKLVLYVYSLKRTNNTELGEKIINNLSFIELVTTEGKSFFYSCDNCGGDGLISCDYCSGTGSVECDECGGSGEVVDDGEEHTCSDCAGNGEVSCNYCGGDGDFNCDDCDGAGEIESDDEVFYSIYTIMTWNKQIQDICELRENTTEPAMSEYEFDRLRDEYIVLSLDEEEYGPLDVVENEMYCVGTSDEPSLKFSPAMSVIWVYSHKRPEHLFR